MVFAFLSMCSLYIMQYYKFSMLSTQDEKKGDFLSSSSCGSAIGRYTIVFSSPRPRPYGLL